MTSIRLVKSSKTRDQTQNVFNELEARQRHQEIVADAVAEAERIFDAARSDADEIKQQVRQEAFDVGLNQGLKAAQDRVAELAHSQATKIADERLQTALPAITAAVDGLQQLQQELESSTLDTSVEVCLALIEKLFHQQIKVNPKTIRDLIAEPIRMAAGCDRIELRINPDDFTAIGNRPEDFVVNLSGCEDVRIVKDPAITAGGCIVSTNLGQIDAQIETQLQRIADELAP